MISFILWKVLILFRPILHYEKNGILLLISIQTVFAFKLPNYVFFFKISSKILRLYKLAWGQSFTPVFLLIFWRKSLAQCFAAFWSDFTKLWSNSEVSYEVKKFWMIRRYLKVTSYAWMNTFANMWFSCKPLGVFLNTVLFCGKVATLIWCHL